MSEASTRGRNTDVTAVPQTGNTAAVFCGLMGPRERRRSRIDVSRHVAEMERVLRACESPAWCEEVIALLRCWQDDEVLDDASRQRAQMLVREFGSRSAQLVGWRS